MLIQRLILEDYGLDIDYVKGDKITVTDALSILPMNRNQDTTQYYTYKKEILSEINDTEKLTEGIFTINFKRINQYQWKDPSLKAKYVIFMYQKGSFRERVIYILTL